MGLPQNEPSTSSESTRRGDVDARSSKKEIGDKTRC